MKNKILIREARISDIPKMQELRKTGWQDNYVNTESGVTKELLQNVLAKMPPSKEDIKFNKGMLKDPKNKGKNLVAVLGEDIVGVVFYNTLDNGNGDIGVFVDRKYRGKGIGTKILEGLIKKTNNTLEVTIFAKNKSINLYRKFGFAQVGEDQKEFFDKNIYLPTKRLVLER